MVTKSRFLEAPRRLRAFVRAHETSLVVLAALIGVIGAMCVRYYFAARRLGFVIGRDGSISPLAQGRVKRVAHGAPAS